MGGGVWACLEIVDGGLPESSLELVCEARRLADRMPGGQACAVIPGPGAAGLAGTAARHGADRVYCGDADVFPRSRPERFAAVLAGLIRRDDPSVVLFAATDAGRDLAPRVAATLRTGLVTGCDRLDLSDDGVLAATRLCFGKKVHATVRCPGARPQMATVEPGIAKVRARVAPAAAVSVEIVPVLPGDFGAPAGDRVAVTGFIKADPGTVDLADAEIVVAGGKGAAGADGFRLVEELAGALGGSVGGSRVAVDNGWIPRERQIGQSGKTVSPRLLVSCGISGAHAHVSAIRDAGVIVSINIDRNAPIHALADLAVVGDMNAILPALSERIRRGGE